MDALLIGDRLVHFGTAMLLLGIAVFEAGLLPQGLRSRFGWWAPLRLVLVALAVVTGVFWFMLETAAAGSGWADALSPDMLIAMATQTAFGQVWIVHLALTLLLVPALRLRGDAGGCAFAIGVAASLGSLGFVGHAAIQDGASGVAHEFNHAVHLLASGFWVGSLLPVLLCLTVGRHAGQEVAVALRRFSGLGHAAVALTLLTGVANTVLVLGTWPLDFTSPYQALLAIKIALVAVMVVIALVNRYAVMPRVISDPDGAGRALAIGTVSEIVLGAIVVGLVSAFATFPPA